MKSLGSWLAVLIGLILCATCSAPLAAQSEASEGTMRSVARSVVQVLPRNCATNRTGSGFVWADAQQVVTARHVVAGCASVSVLVDGQSITASVVREFRRADLVLLRLARRVSVPPLELSNSSPHPNDVLEAIGFYYGVPGVDNRRLTVTIGSTTLRDMLPVTLRKELVEVGSPDPLIDIVRVDGHLLPGLSGAPVINAAGRVVGIGSGGLENGAAAVSWAISARYLKDLLTAPAGARLTQDPRQSSLFFSAEEGYDQQPQRCGELTFIRTRHSTVGNLLRTTDDPQGFTTFSRSSLLPEDQLLDTELDVLEEPDSGASVPVPAGMSLTNAYGMCRLTFSSGNVALWITSARVDSGQQFDRAALGWEEIWSQLFPDLHWVADPTDTYAAAVTRESDGLITRRKDLTGRNGSTDVVKAFETLISRGNTAVGIVIMRTSESDEDPAALRRCLTSPDREPCPQLLREYSSLVSAVSSAYLATFPPQ